jgi:hypothetical protein
VTTENGGKLELRLQSATADSVLYVGALDAPVGSFPCEVTLSMEGGRVDVVVLHGGAEPPRWLVEWAKSIVRGLWRGRRGGPEAATWPRRITRWRAAAEPS